MFKLIDSSVLAGAALVLATVVMAATKTRAASPATVLTAGRENPTVPYWHVWTDEKGVSHQKQPRSRQISRRT